MFKKNPNINGWVEYQQAIKQYNSNNKHMQPFHEIPDIHICCHDVLLNLNISREKVDLLLTVIFGKSGF